MPAERIAGTASIELDGTSLALGGTLSIDSFDVTRSNIEGLSGVVGFKEMPRTPSMECETYLTSLTDLERLRNLTDTTVTATLANGKVYTLRNAWLAETPVIDAAEGKMTLKFQGLKMDRGSAS